jgi:TRAP-type C4-dicarboxylate transport system substrate-binding protein
LERRSIMFTKNALIKTIFMVITILALAACATQASSTGTSAPAAAATSAPVAASSQAKPISLTLATYDDQNSASAPYILEFTNQVSTLSGGSLTIVPTYGVDSEQHVIQQVNAGQFDLGLVASRAWDTANVTSFQALQAPFLISNDALAIAVATSDTARQMLDSLSSAGYVGLTLWPEDLRHPFSVTDKPLLSPADFKGLQIRTPPSGVSNMLIQQLGATPMYEDSGYQGAESGLRQGGTLTGRPIATGNVTFYPKFQVLIANAAAFKKLSQGQQKVLNDAAAATQKKAIAEHPTDAVAGSAYCADGGSVVLASADQIAAFEQAAQPVFDSIEKDPANTKYIAAIRDLKAKTPASAGAAACQPQAAQTSAQPTAAGTQVWSAGTLPNGVWTVKLSADELFQMGDLRSVASDWAGTYTLSLQDGNFTIPYDNGQGFTAKCQGTYAVVGDIVRLTYLQVTAKADECPGEVDNVQWRLDGQGLHIHLVDAQNADFGATAAMWEAKPWQKVQ